jgi:Ca2+-binding EF-hand superfamily protein
MRPFPLSAILLAILPSMAIAQSADRPAAASKDVAAQPADDVQDLIVLAEKRPIFVRWHVRVGGQAFREHWRDFMRPIFGELDRDGDGVLSKAEAAKAPILDGVLLTGRGVVNRRDPPLARAGDGEGRVTWESFLRAYELGPTGPLNSRLGNGRSRLGNAVLALLDTDRDGNVSAAELRSAEASLRKRDYDDDEIVSNVEVAPGQSGFALVAVDAARVRPDVMNAGRMLIAVSAGSAAADEVSQRLIARYDTNGDGSLSLGDPASAEIQLLGATGRTLDWNRDGLLDRSELGRFADRTPDAEFSCDLAPGAAGGSVPATDRRDDAGHQSYALRGGSGSPWVVDAGDVQLEIRSSSPPVRPAVSNPQVDQNRFRVLDQDNNGFVDETEGRRVGLADHLFSSIDRDGDGKLVKDELNDYFLRQQAAAARRFVVQVTDDGQQLFEMLDKDRDGRLSLREMRLAGSLIESTDANRDGSLSGAEIPRRIRLELVPETAATGAAAGIVVSGGGMIRQALRGAVSEAGPSWFRRMDRNHDGDVSPREFLGPRAEFDKLDADRDGLLDLREATATGSR